MPERTRTYHIRFDPDLRKAIDNQAEALGYREVSDFIRDALAFAIGRPELSVTHQLNERGRRLAELVEKNLRSHRK